MNGWEDARYRGAREDCLDRGSLREKNRQPLHACRDDVNWAKIECLRTSSVADFWAATSFRDGPGKACSIAGQTRAGGVTFSTARPKGAKRRSHTATAWRADALPASSDLNSARSSVQKQQTEGAYVAVVNRGGDQPAPIIRVDLSSHTVFVRPVATEVPQGRSLELWYIGQGKAPKSMGLVDHAPKSISLPADASVEKANFAVTVEPEGGSPTGGPTGPIVYSGQFLKE